MIVMHKLRLSSFVGCMVVLMTTGAARADFIVSGSWNGYLETTTYTYKNASLVSVTTVDSLGGFSLSYDVDSDLLFLSGSPQYASYVDFEPTSLTGNAFLGASKDGADILNFGIYFPSLPSDGILDNSNSGAAYDVTYFNTSEGNGQDVFVNFSTSPVPEPSSIALAFPVVLTAAAMVVARRRRG